MQRGHNETKIGDDLHQTSFASTLSGLEAGFPLDKETLNLFIKVFRVIVVLESATGRYRIVNPSRMKKFLNSQSLDVKSRISPRLIEMYKNSIFTLNSTNSLIIMAIPKEFAYSYRDRRYTIETASRTYFWPEGTLVWHGDFEWTKVRKPLVVVRRSRFFKLKRRKHTGKMAAYAEVVTPTQIALSDEVDRKVHYLLIGEVLILKKDYLEAQLI